MSFHVWGARASGACPERRVPLRRGRAVALERELERIRRERWIARRLTLAEPPRPRDRPPDRGEPPRAASGSKRRPEEARASASRSSRRSACRPLRRNSPYVAPPAGPATCSAGRALRTLTTAITSPASRIPLLLAVLLVQWILGKLGGRASVVWRLARRQCTRRHGDRRNARPPYGGSHRRADAGARHRRPRLREHRPSVNAMRRAPAIAC